MTSSAGGRVAAAASSKRHASTPSGRRHARTLYWQGALRLRELGVERLNLGGGIVDGDGLAQFKRRFGAPVIRTLPFRHVLAVEGLAHACSMAGVETAAAGRFPPWIGR